MFWLNCTRWLAAALACVLCVSFWAPAASAQQRDKITILIFSPPWPALLG
jgi:hypothetical protein